MSLKNQIKQLVELQKLDGEIYEIKKQLNEKPAVIEELKQQFESSKARLNQLEQQGKGIQLKRKEQELDLQKEEEDIRKANSALNLLKTNKEYQAKLNEIESLKADKSRTEEIILKSFDESDALNGDIEKEKNIVAEREKEFTEKKKIIEAEMKLLEDRLNVLDAQRKQNIPEADKHLLAVYERLLPNKNGQAIVPVVSGNSCGGCFMNVTAQQMNQIKMGTELVLCEFCARILYIEENL